MAVEATLLTVLVVTGDERDITLTKAATRTRHAQFPMPTARCAPALAQLSTVGLRKVQVANNDYHGAARTEIEALLPGWKVTSTQIPMQSQWNGTSWDPIDPVTTKVVAFELKYQDLTVLEPGAVGQQQADPTKNDQAFLTAGVMLQHPV